MLFRPSHEFFDSSGNFQSSKFLALAQKARKGLQQGWTKKESVFDFELSFGNLSAKDVWIFVNKLANFLNSGIDLKSAIGMLHKQANAGRFKTILSTLRTNLEYGLSLSDTLKQYQKDFSPLVISLIEIGEKTGTLPRILSDLDKKLLDSINLRKKVKGALTYPIVLITLTIGMVIFMMSFVIPKISETFIKAKVDLPALTQFVIDISNALRNHYILIIVGAVAIVGIFKLIGKIRYGKLLYDAIALKLPIFGYIVRMSNVITFTTSLALLLDSWVLMLESLETTINTVENLHFKKDIARIKNEMEAGIKLSNAMGLTVSNRESVFSNPYFPEDLVHMISVGEETGTIGKTIDRIGNNYTKDLNGYIGNLVTMLEPLILVVVGWLVGTIVVAIMLPFFNMGKVIQKS